MKNVFASNLKIIRINLKILGEGRVLEKKKGEKSHYIRKNITITVCLWHFQ